MTKQIVVSCKCSDMAHVRIVDAEGTILEEHEGYMPYIQGLGGGDYIHFIVDNETGRIFGWEPVHKLIAEG